MAADDKSYARLKSLFGDVLRRVTCSWYRRYIGEGRWLIGTGVR